jgi:hypothetical protein
MKHFDVEKIMARERALLDRRQKAIERKVSKINALEEQIAELRASLTSGSKTVRSGTSKSTSGISRERVARRGLITYAILSLFKTPKQKLTTEQILLQLAKNPQLKDIPELSQRVYTLLNTNKKRFERVGKQEFRVNERPKSTLFKNLKEELATV